MAYDDHFQLIGEMSVSEDGTTIYFGARSPEEAEEAFNDVTDGKTPDMIGRLTLNGDRIELDVSDIEDITREVSKTIIALKLVDQLSDNVTLPDQNAINLALDIKCANQTINRDFEVALYDLGNSNDLGSRMHVKSLADKHLVYRR
jgi:hypothetical protein